MQSKLAAWAAEDPNRRFDRLLRLVSSRTWLLEAARISLSSKGAHTPGIDGIRKHHIEENLNEYLEQIRGDLLSGGYQPTPARRVYILKANGKKRPLGIPTLRDRIVQRAILMAIEPIWESDFHRLSYGFRPQRSVHHAIRTVRLQLQDGTYPAGRWVIEGDLSSYFDTVHHKLLLKGLRKRIRDKRLLSLLWRFIKAGHVERNLFRASSEGVPQGGVISPLLSNIMLHEFDQWLERRYLNGKTRKDRWAWNFGIQQQRPIVAQEGRQWKPAVAYCRYADDFVLIIKGTKAHAASIREECREFLEDGLKLTLNMEKTHITHVNDGFIFLGHRIIRKRGPRGTMRPVTTIPREKAKNFARKLTKELSGDYSANKIDLIESLNRRLNGWATFYKFTDYTATTFSKLDRIIFWKLAHWLARKYQVSMKQLMKYYVRHPANGTAKTWVLTGQDNNGVRRTVALRRLVSSPKSTFRWTLPRENPYILSGQTHPSLTSRYDEIAMAMSHS
jgi:RNA-directed DNA polymerase